MRQWLRVVLTGGSVWALMALLPFAIAPADAQDEIHLNSSNLQVVHNTPANTDVLNMSLNVTNDGDGDPFDPCDLEKDDLLETGVHVSVSKHSCLDYFFICLGGCPAFDFDAQVNYVEHDIGSLSYGTSFALNAAGSVSSKIVALATPAATCGTWSINLQATGQNLSAITGTPIALFLNDSDNDGDGDDDPVCFNVNVNIGNGLVKPHQGLHHAHH